MLCLNKRFSCPIFIEILTEIFEILTEMDLKKKFKKKNIKEKTKNGYIPEILYL